MNVVEIVFSPTGGTEKVANIIGGHWSSNAVRIDLSDSKIDFTKCNIEKRRYGFGCNAFLRRTCSSSGNREVETD